MIKYVAFDFDGTLADSVDFCLHVFDSVLRKYMGEKAPSLEEIYQNFGMNEPGVLRFFMGYADKNAENDFYEMHRKLHPEMCPAAFPGCCELLEFLRSKNIKIGILTGRAEISCQISMQMLDLGKYFEFFKYGSPESNDKSAHLRSIIEDNGLTADELLYIGDAVSDAQSSHRANVKCLSAAWARSARGEELEKVNPGLVFFTVEDMIEYLKTVL